MFVTKLLYRILYRLLDFFIWMFYVLKRDSLHKSNKCKFEVIVHESRSIALLLYVFCMKPILRSAQKSPCEWRRSFIMLRWTARQTLQRYFQETIWLKCIYVKNLRYQVTNVLLTFHFFQFKQKESVSAWYPRYSEIIIKVY